MLDWHLGGSSFKKECIRTLAGIGFEIELKHNGRFANRYSGQHLFARYVSSGFHYVAAGLSAVIFKYFNANSIPGINPPICYAVSLIVCKISNRRFNLSLYPIIANIFCECVCNSLHKRALRNCRARTACLAGERC